jgi:hypothetical protein
LELQVVKNNRVRTKKQHLFGAQPGSGLKKITHL